MKEIIAAIVVAALSYLIAIQFGIWCGTATFLILLIAYKEFTE